ncbi:DUF2255 family protein [Pseudolysinimonas sp.]
MSEFAHLAGHLGSSDTVAIVTTRPSGQEVATPIWSAAVDGVPYVRPAYGPRTSWHLRARSGRPVAFTLVDGRNAERDAVAALRDPRLPVTVQLADDPDELDRVDEAFREKYRDSPYVGSVVGGSARAGTLRVQPA